jgi:hypothetical protein
MTGGESLVRRTMLPRCRRARSARHSGPEPDNEQLAMAFSVLLFEHGMIKSLEFFDAEEFCGAKERAISSIEDQTADEAEVHDDRVGLVFRYTQLLS